MFGRKKEEKEIKQEILPAVDDLFGGKSIFESITAESTPALERVVLELSNKLFDEKNIRMTTDLSTSQIREVFKYIVIDSEFYKDYAWREEEENPKLYNHFTSLFNQLLILAVSKDRKGREEAVSLASGFKQKLEEQLLKSKLGLK